MDLRNYLSGEDGMGRANDTPKPAKSAGGAKITAPAGSKAQTAGKTSGLPITPPWTRRRGAKVVTLRDPIVGKGPTARAQSSPTSTPAPRPGVPVREIRVKELTADDLINYPDPPRDILPGMPLGEFGLLTAEAKAGKSFLAALMALAVATGEDLGNTLAPEYPGGSRVLFVTLEESEPRLLRRLAAICEHYGLLDDDTAPLLSNLRISARGDTVWPAVSIGQMDDAVDVIRNTIATHRAKFVVLDPLAQFQVEESNEVLHAFGGRLNEAAIDHDCCIVLVHHMRKRIAANEEITLDSVRGGGALVAAARFVLALTRGDDGRRTLLNLGASHSADSGETHWRIVSRHMRNGDVGVPVKWTASDAEAGLDKTDIRAALLHACALPPESRKVGVQSRDGWIGLAVAEQLQFDIGAGLLVREKTPQQRAAYSRVKNLLANWESEELLTRETIKRENSADQDVYCAGPRLTTPG